ncbi:hypothetical protein BKK44_30425 [Bacillus cereus]|nr:hypothetical protein BKK44_30425 [Bacillus cereus]
MREIEFRGKPIEDYGDTKWFYGNAVINYEDKLAYIEAVGQGFVPVKWDTVGQYTCLEDKNGNRIYEGDIINFKLDDYTVPFTQYIKFVGGTYQTDDYHFYLHEISHNVEIIGDIYENPELLQN